MRFNWAAVPFNSYVNTSDYDELLAFTLCSSCANGSDLIWPFTCGLVSSSWRSQRCCMMQTHLQHGWCASTISSIDLSQQRDSQLTPSCERCGVGGKWKSGLCTSWTDCIIGGTLTRIGLRRVSVSRIVTLLCVGGCQHVYYVNVLEYHVPL